MDVNRRWWLYILRLEDNKWYVGITSKTPEERFKEHQLHKRGAYWTMKHNPLEIELVEDLGIVSKQHAETYESKITRTLMRERGLNNVRGGDLRDAEDYIVRFGNVYLKENWYAITLVVLLMLVIIWLLIDKYFL
jgi:predicted GIY-YIG superfamily endonuclease